ncbi:MAG: hypothetical protein PVH88_27895 [Ignavibacteria bacterium]|jgi:hypothetical protein
MNKYQDYLKDLNFLLIEMALKAKDDMLKSKGTKEENYKTGYLMGFHRVLSLIEQQLDGFQIKKKDVGLDNFDTDEQLLN